MTQRYLAYLGVEPGQLSEGRCWTMKKWIALASAAGAAAFAALLAGKDDIRRFRRMRQM